MVSEKKQYYIRLRGRKVVVFRCHELVRPQIFYRSFSPAVIDVNSRAYAENYVHLPYHHMFNRPITSSEVTLLFSVLNS
jgi:hypothetical protein